MKKTKDRIDWAIGGCLMIGMGIGLFFLYVSVLIFIGCILAGLGLGLLITSILSAFGKR
jgi:hypothetical protein